jgi:hypothetical protein
VHYMVVGRAELSRHEQLQDAEPMTWTRP